MAPNANDDQARAAASLEDSQTDSNGGHADASQEGVFTPVLTTTDWNEEWKALQQSRRHRDEAAEWDKRAETFPVSHGSHSGYVERFLELAGIRPGETVLDMGCGTGAIATPLAKAGHAVIAADFSRGMLDVMEADQRANQVQGVTAIQMSWEDDWNAHGVAPKSVDVAVASRSIATHDLASSLAKLTSVARRRVCITLSSGSSPRIDERLLNALGLQNHLGRDFVYAFNILAHAGVKPEVAYVPSARYETFDTFEEACSAFEAMVRAACSGRVPSADLESAVEKLPRWLEDNLAENPRAGEQGRADTPEKRLRLKEVRVMTWAFLGWNV